MTDTDNDAVIDGGAVDTIGHRECTDLPGDDVGAADRPTHREAGLPGEAACELRHVNRPCAECPWRRDTEPGKFPAERFEALQDTSGAPGREAPVGAPMFACHMTKEGREQACAGWLATAGHYHLGVRMAILQDRLDPGVLWPQPDWPALFDNYDDMAERQAGE